MRKLKTPEEIIIGSSPFGHDLRNNTVFVRAIKAAQRDALECAAENARVKFTTTDSSFEVDETSILNLLPKES